MKKKKDNQKITKADILVLKKIDKLYKEEGKEKIKRTKK